MFRIIFKILRNFFQNFSHFSRFFFRFFRFFQIFQIYDKKNRRNRSKTGPEEPIGAISILQNEMEFNVLSSVQSVKSRENAFISLSNSLDFKSKSKEESWLEFLKDSSPSIVNHNSGKDREEAENNGGNGGNSSVISPNNSSVKKKKKNKLMNPFGSVSMRKRPVSMNISPDSPLGVFQRDESLSFGLFEEIKSHPKRLASHDNNVFVSSDINSNNNNNEEIHSGILFIKRKSGRWKNQRATLYNDSIQFKSVKKSDKLPKNFSLNLASVRLTDSSKDLKHFSIFLLQNVLHCQCSLEKEATEWIAAIHKVCESLVLDAINNTTSSKSPKRSKTPSQDFCENPEVTQLMQLPGNNSCADCGASGKSNSSFLTIFSAFFIIFEFI
eukprot:TRINITY_DN1489_c0_g1_i2.p1 TRINITY_DN1489_c0_g1~~TRINITY_DN1489_c0_g1_i2.p1  ORF type:complete len:384 (+),score=123.60 TRINITY_DN1489_c0_g1_i2:203-1354(+)